MKKLETEAEMAIWMCQLDLNSRLIPSSAAESLPSGATTAFESYSELTAITLQWPLYSVSDFEVNAEQVLLQHRGRLGSFVLFAINDAESESFGFSPPVLMFGEDVWPSKSAKRGVQG